MAMIRIAHTLLAFTLLTSGCFWVTTKHEGEELRRDLNKLDKRVAESEEGVGERVAKLQDVLDQATKLLTRNSADLGAEVNTMVQEQAALRGMVSEAQRAVDELVRAIEAREKMAADRMAALEERLARLEQGASRKTPDEMYAEGKTAYDRRDYKEAIALFRQLVVAQPGHALADDAQFYRAEAHARLKQAQDAISEFQRVFEKYPRSELADDSLFRAGEISEDLKRCTDARAYFGLMLKKYPRSELASDAKKKERDLKRLARNKRRCTS